MELLTYGFLSPIPIIQRLLDRFVGLHMSGASSSLLDPFFGLKGALHFFISFLLNLYIYLLFSIWICFPLFFQFSIYVYFDFCMILYVINQVYFLCSSGDDIIRTSYSRSALPIVGSLLVLDASGSLVLFPLNICLHHVPKSNLSRNYLSLFNLLLPF